MNLDVGEIGLILSVAAPLVGVIYGLLVLRLNKQDEALDQIREKFVTRDFFDERTKHQDRALDRIERHLGTLPPRAAYRSSHD